MRNVVKVKPKLISLITIENIEFATFVKVIENLLNKQLKIIKYNGEMIAI